MTFIQIPKESFICLLLMAAGVPVYFLGVKWKKPQSIQSKLGKLILKEAFFLTPILSNLKAFLFSNALDKITILVQKLTYSVFDESKLE
jgi:hypothetical protein